MANRTKFTAKKRGEFLEALLDTGSVSEAARVVGISRRRLYDLRDEDPTFKQDWEEALDEYAETLEREADRRAVEGTTKPVFYQGARCGEIQEYSDTLLMFRLKALKPDKYRERSDVKHSGTVNSVVGIDFIMPAGFKSEGGDE